MKNSALAPIRVAGPLAHKVLKYAAQKLISDLRDHSPRYPETVHEEAMSDLTDVLDSLAFEFGEKNAHKLMRGFFEDYICGNNVREKAEADGCDVMEYLGLSESEVYALMGCEDEEESC